MSESGVWFSSQPVPLRGLLRTRCSVSRIVDNFLLLFRFLGRLRIFWISMPALPLFNCHRTPRFRPILKPGCTGRHKGKHEKPQIPLLRGWGTRQTDVGWDFGMAGLEPAASRSRTERTTKLCYIPMKIEVRRGSDYSGEIMKIQSKKLVWLADGCVQRLGRARYGCSAFV